jgi:hypothetical protein
MLLTVRDEAYQYRIECPDHDGIKLNHCGADYLIVPDPDDPGAPFWLFDEFLIDAARGGDLGLRLISEEPL